jgi:hypothetical protein
MGSSDKPVKPEQLQVEVVCVRSLEGVCPHEDFAVPVVTRGLPEHLPSGNVHAVGTAQPDD